MPCSQVWDNGQAWVKEIGSGLLVLYPVWVSVVCVCADVVVQQGHFSHQLLEGATIAKEGFRFVWARRNGSPVGFHFA